MKVFRNFVLVLPIRARLAVGEVTNWLQNRRCAGRGMVPIGTSAGAMGGGNVNPGSVNPGLVGRNGTPGYQNPLATIDSGEMNFSKFGGKHYFCTRLSGQTMLKNAGFDRKMIDLDTADFPRIDPTRGMGKNVFDNKKLSKNKSMLSTFFRGDNANFRGWIL